MKKLVACLKVYAFAIATLGKKEFKKESTQLDFQDILFI
jgi:hypothetical protein